LPITPEEEGECTVGIKVAKTEALYGLEMRVVCPEEGKIEIFKSDKSGGGFSF
jgi:hypothetical protein